MLKISSLVPAFVFLCMPSLFFAMDNTRSVLSLIVSYLPTSAGDRYPVSCYRLQNMNFPIEPEKLQGKNIVTVLPISSVDQENILLALQRADKSNKVEEVVYTLDQKQYLSKIAVFRASEKKDTQNKLFCVDIEEAVIL